MIASPDTFLISTRVALFLLVSTVASTVQAQFFVPPDPQPGLSPGNYTPPDPSRYDPAYPNYIPPTPTPPKPDIGLEIAKEIIGALTQPPPRPPRPYPGRPNYIYPQPSPQPKIVSPPKPKPVEPLKNQVTTQPLKPLSNVIPLSLAKKADRRLVVDMLKQVDHVAFEANEGLKAILDARLPPLPDLVSSVAKGRTLEEQQRILEQAKAGDAGFIELATAGDPSPEAEMLRDYTRAASALNKVVDAAKQGKLNNTLRQQFLHSLEAGGFNTKEEFVSPFFAMLDNANDVAYVLSKAQPNAPSGPLDCILYVGNMPQSEVILLGGGGCLVGTGGETSGVILADANLGQALDMNIAAGSPVPDDDGDAVFQDAVITNTGSTEVNFVVNSDRAKLLRGATKSFPVLSSSRIEFFPSESAAKKAFRLEKASYEFRLSEGSWGVFKVRYTVTLDNSENSTDFRYVSENEHATLKAGKSSQISSPYPVVIRFDDGTGDVKQKRLTKGVFKVGLTSSGSFELYAAENVSSPKPLADLIAETSVDLFGRWASTDQPLTFNKESSTLDSSNSAPQLFD